MIDLTPIRDGNAKPVRTLPHCIEAEKAFLGAIFIERGATIMDHAAAYLRPEHFSYGPHGHVFQAMLKLHQSGKPISPPMLSHFFEASEALAEIGGGAYLSDLAHSAVTPINAREYAKLIHDLWRRRELIVALEVAAGDLYGAEAETDEVLERHETALGRLVDNGVDHGGPAPMSELFAPTLGEIEHAVANAGTVGLTTGINDLDRFTGGLMPSDLIVVAARPGMGKTALALTIALANARVLRRVALFSLEMSAEQMLMRLLAMETGVAASDMRSGAVGDPELGQIRGAADALTALPIVVDDRGGIPVPYIRSKAKAIRRQSGLDLVIVDYLGLIRPDQRYFGNRVHEISEITGGLKALAKELGVPVVALSQLSRNVEQRDDKRPRLSDLRDSGSIEQDADVVMFIYRFAYYLDQEGEPQPRADEDEGDFVDRYDAWRKKRDAARGKAEIGVAKQRMGRVGTVPVHFNETRTLFGDLAR